MIYNYNKQIQKFLKSPGYQINFDDLLVKPNDYENWNFINDPTYLGFQIEFLFDQDSINLDLTYHSKYKKNTSEITPHSCLLLPGDNGYSAINYLKNVGRPEYTIQATDFVNHLKNIQLNLPWMFQGISGLDEILKIRNTQNTNGTRFGSDGLTLTLNCLETIDGKMNYLSSLYRRIFYDQEFRRILLPHGKRNFNMRVYLYDFRNLFTAFSQNFVENISDKYRGKLSSGQVVTNVDQGLNSQGNNPPSGIGDVLTGVGKQIWEIGKDAVNRSEYGKKYREAKKNLMNTGNILGDLTGIKALNNNPLTAILPENTDVTEFNNSKLDSLSIKNNQYFISNTNKYLKIITIDLFNCEFLFDDFSSYNSLTQDKRDAETFNFKIKLEDARISQSYGLYNTLISEYDYESGSKSTKVFSNSTPETPISEDEVSKILNLGKNESLDTMYSERKKSTLNKEQGNAYFGENVVHDSLQAKADKFGGGILSRAIGAFDKTLRNMAIKELDNIEQRNSKGVENAVGITKGASDLAKEVRNGKIDKVVSIANDINKMFLDLTGYPLQEKNVPGSKGNGKSFSGEADLDKNETQTTGSRKRKKELFISKATLTENRFNGDSINNNIEKLIKEQGLSNSNILKDKLDLIDESKVNNSENVSKENVLKDKLDLIDESTKRTVEINSVGPFETTTNDEISQIELTGNYKSSEEVDPDLFNKYKKGDSVDPDLFNKYKPSEEVDPDLFNKYKPSEEVDPDLFNKYKPSEEVDPDLFNKYKPSEEVDPDLFNKYKKGNSINPDLFDNYKLGETVDPDLFDNYKLGETVDPDLFDNYKLGETVDPDLFDKYKPGEEIDPDLFDNYKTTGISKDVKLENDYKLSDLTDPDLSSFSPKDKLDVKTLEYNTNINSDYEMLADLTGTKKNISIEKTIELPKNLKNSEVTKIELTGTSQNKKIDSDVTLDPNFKSTKIEDIKIEVPPKSSEKIKSVDLKPNQVLKSELKDLKFDINTKINNELKDVKFEFDNSKDSKLSNVDLSFDSMNNKDFVKDVGIFKRNTNIKTLDKTKVLSITNNKKTKTQSGILDDCIDEILELSGSDIIFPRNI